MRKSHIRRFAAAIAAALLAPVAVQAESASVCVTCSDPALTYLCRVQGADVDDRVLQHYCIARTAAEGGHKFCGASRTPPDACVGAERSYVYEESAVPPALEATAAPPPALSLDRPRPLRPNAESNAASAADEAPESILEESARPVGPIRRVGGAIRATGQAVGGVAQTTGQRVGTAARTTVRCVRTLLRDCAPPEAPPVPER